MTHRTAGEAHAQRLIRLYSALNECDQAIIRSRNQSELFRLICDRIIHSGLLDMAWVGMLDASDQSIKPLAHAGHNLNYLDFILLAQEQPAHCELDALHLALRENQTYWVQDIATDPLTLAMGAFVRTQGWHSVAFLPLTLGNESAALGVLSIYSKEIKAFDELTRQLLTQLASNISHALAAFENEAQRRETEFALQESEVRYNALFASSCMPMVLVNPFSGRIIDANIRAVNFYGWNQREFSSMHVSDISMPGDKDIMHELARVVSTGESHFDIKHRLADGAVRDVEVFSSRIGYGGETYLMLAVHDVSGQRCAERRVRAAQGLTQLFIDQLPGVAYLKDSHARVVMANRHLGALVGAAPQNLVGKTADEIFPPDFAKLLNQLDQDLLAKGGHMVAEETYADRHFENRMFVIDDASGERYLGGISMDVTERYNTAARTHALLQIHELGSGQLSERDFLTLGLEMAEALTHSQIGFLHFVNDDQETLELVTWSSGALKGCTAGYDAHYPISQAGIWADCLRQSEAVIFNDYAAYPAKRGLPEGHAGLNRLISVPVIDGDKVRMMLGVGNKVSDYDNTDIETVQLIGNDLWRIVCRARAELALKQRVDELESVNSKLAEIQLQLLQSEKLASIGQLAAGVAHEINNPIGFVKSNLGSLAQYVSQLLALTQAYVKAGQSVEGADFAAFESARQLLQTSDFEFLSTDLPSLISETREGVDRVSKIVMDLKNFSRVGDTDFQWSDLHQGLESTINVIWNELKYKADVVREYGALPQVYCVASHLNQVFMNLLVNAAQAIVEHGRITVRTGVQASQVWIEVQDTGSGIEPDKLTRIFDPFYTTKPIGKGTGLGLSIASRIVSQHHGSLIVASVPGQGSTFRMTLPIDAREKPNLTLAQAGA